MAEPATEADGPLEYLGSRCTSLSYGHYGVFTPPSFTGLEIPLGFCLFSPQCSFPLNCPSKYIHLFLLAYLSQPVSSGIHQMQTMSLKLSSAAWGVSLAESQTRNLSITVTLGDGDRQVAA